MPAAGSPAPTTIASVDKALSVVETLLDLGVDGAPLGTLAERTGINKSSLHHILATLRSRGWVTQDESGRYQLGPVAGRIASWWTDANQVVAQLHPTLLEICARTGELVHLGRLYDRHVVYLDKVEPDTPIRVWSRIGRATSVATTAMGRAMLGAAGADDAELRTWAGLVDRPATDLTVRLHEEVARTAAHGYAVEVGEDHPSLACVGVPVSVVGRPVLAISVTMPVERATHERLAEIARTIHDCLGRAHVEGIEAAVPQG